MYRNGFRIYCSSLKAHHRTVAYEASVIEMSSCIQCTRQQAGACNCCGCGRPSDIQQLCATQLGDKSSNSEDIEDGLYHREEKAVYYDEVESYGCSYITAI